MSQWEQFPDDQPTRALRGVWHRDRDDDADPIPNLYADPALREVEVGCDVGLFTVAEAREFARRLVEAADLADGTARP